MTKKRTRKQKSCSPKPRASRVGSGNGSPARHPPHKAHEIRSIGSNRFVGWSIYPEQLAPMILRMQRVLTQMRAVTLTGVAGDTRIVTALLGSIGLSFRNNAGQGQP